MTATLFAPRLLRQGQFALEFPERVPAPALPPTLRLVDDDEFGPVPTPTAALPAVTAWSARLSLAVVEVMAGTRPAHQLSRWVTLGVIRGLHQASGNHQPHRSLRGAAGRRPPLVVRSLRITEPADGVAEVAALIDTGMRPVVLALRLEGRDGRWVCVEVGTPGGWCLGGPDDSPESGIAGDSATNCGVGALSAAA